MWLSKLFVGHVSHAHVVAVQIVYRTCHQTNTQQGVHSRLCYGCPYYLQGMSSNQYTTSCAVTGCQSVFDFRVVMTSSNGPGGGYLLLHMVDRPVPYIWGLVVHVVCVDRHKKLLLPDVCSGVAIITNCCCSLLVASIMRAP